MNKGKIEVNRGATPAIPQTGIGYIVVPTDDNEREQYINDCYRTNTVTIQGGYGCSYISNVKILNSVLQEIKFPSSSSEKGSMIFWVRENFSNRPIVIGVVPDEYYTNLINVNQRRIVKQTEDGLTVEILQDAGECLINVVAFGNNEYPSKITLKSTSGNKDSIIRLETDGSVIVSANKIEATAREAVDLKILDSQNEELTTFTADGDTAEYNDHNNNKITIDEDGLKIESENNVSVDIDGDLTAECDGNANVKTKGDITVEADNSNIDVKANKVSVSGKNVEISTDIGFKLDNGNEPMVLGNTLKGILNDLCIALTSITVTCPPTGGPSSVPINAAQFTAIAARLQTILSNKSKLD